MAIKFDLGQKTTFDNAMRGSNVDATLDAGNKATSRGIKTTKDALSNAVTFVYGLGTGHDEIDSSGARGSLVNSYEDLIHSVDATYTGNYNISGTSEISTQQLMLCAIDVELALVEHLLKISGDTGVSKENRYEARRLAADLAKKIAIDYRNLCIIGNDPAHTPKFAETVNGVNVMTSAPTGKNLYQIYKYVHDNYNTGGDIRSKWASFTGAGLATDHSGSKALPNDSRARFLGVRARDFGRRINPFGKKKLEPEDRDMFGRWHRSDKAGLIITASAVVGLAVAISVTAAVSNFVGKDKTSEDTTGLEDTMAPEDTAINNPALDSVVTEAELATNADGEVVTEPESDTNDYDEPSADRNDDYGYSEDFVNPNEEERTLPDEPEEDEPEVESEEPVKTTETSEEEFDEDEPAGRY